jgi:hypothetical protein
MYMTLEVLDPRVFWHQLPLLGKCYALFLGVAAIYIIISLSHMLLGVYSLKKQPETGEHRNRSLVLALLRKRAENLHQLIFFKVLLFGLTFFFQSPAAFLTFGDSKYPYWSQILQNLAVHFAFATDIFLVLLFLHSAQWFVSARLSSAEIHFTLRR